ncbi:exocyst complex component 8-like isoform X2 [Acanthaster planci]|uniref:Exocyst complex component 8 n=1 Tax=Acanthaster planci TaxID=133434 RepID=A0A8B7YF17_ACAPL|nr:exocyst complex component 8-like isoform X2 [Acanthaster planci]
MADHMKKQLSSDDFDAQKHVFDICSGGDVYNDLLEHRQKVQMLSEDTAINLKKNVYRNYTQFIDTSKEISYLEGEMYQLSHVLTEQKAIMSQMLEMSIGNKEASARNKDMPQSKDDQKRTIASLLDRVEGCSRITEVPGRYIVHDGDLVELDTDTFSEVQRVHAYLLNDSLVITTFVPNRRGPVRYKYQVLYELDSLAVVNVRDVGPVKNAFKILMFPDQRIYRADNSRTKRTWLDKLEEAKKTKAAADAHRRELAEQMSVESSDYNPFDEEDDVTSPVVPVESTSMLKVEWLLELPEDLDMCIAQRNFEEATDLIIKTNTYLDSVPQSPALKEMRARVDHRVKQLTDVLTRELQVSPDRSLRGGPQVTRRAVTQLIRLGRATQACDLFLKNRSASIKQSLRQLRIEGATSMYITKLCGVFFHHIIETGKEFRFTFAENQGCFSAFVVWSKAELKTFANHFSRQALAKKTSLSTVAECVSIARSYCQQLSVIGLELLFALNSLLLRGIREALQYNKDQLIEASRHRNVDERWFPLNLKNRTAANTLIQDMHLLGFEDFNTLVYDECFVRISSSNVAFTKVLLTFLHDALKLYLPELYPDLVWTIKDVMDSHVHLMETAVTSDRFEDERHFIMKNVDYIFNRLLPLLEKKLKNVADRSLKELKELHKRHEEIMKKVLNLGALI